jgi:hypothetical protein
MMRTLATASVLTFVALATPVTAQSPSQGPQSGLNAGNAPGTNRCHVMSREEMELCKRTKPGDVSGARSSLCDAMPTSEIESCLQQSQSPQPQSDASVGNTVERSQADGPTLRSNSHEVRPGK